MKIDIKKATKIKEKRSNCKGITLIALVITIIVLLILAAVSIATLTGDNGILTKAMDAKKNTIIEEEKEQIKLAYSASLTKKDYDGIIRVEELNHEFENLNVEAVASGNNPITVTFSKTGNIYTIDNKGIITGPETSEMDPFITMEEAREIEKFEKNTKVKDQYGNKIVIPEGFKIADDSADNVTSGVVIEDISYEETKGSQFVWVPVGEIYTAQEHTEANKKTIKLGRYNFAEDGTPTDYSGDFKEENVSDTENLLNYGNSIAKNIEEFKTSVGDNGGYYIGRYEARTAEERKAKTGDNGLTRVTVKENDYIYNWVTQPQAADLSKKMYASKSFTSDLINGYAWDTAIVFVQIFDNRNDTTKPYARQNSLNTTFAKQGTNNLSNIAHQDKVCNIWDMASNEWEWTTETHVDSSSPCVIRGSGYSYSSQYYTSSYDYYDTSYANSFETFRLILYL